MNEIDIVELKKIEVTLLKSVDSICNKENLRYSLGYGTLLGAIRHKGFIPWDDDIDIMMPRPDYDKFIDFCSNNETDFVLLAYEDKDHYPDLITKVCAKGTTIIEENTNRFQKKIGVYIDIFPIEGLGNSYDEAKANFNRSGVYRELLNASLWNKYFKSKTHSLIYEPLRFGLFVVSRIVSPLTMLKKISNIYEKLKYDECDYVGVIGSPYRVKDIFDKKILESYSEIEFEGQTFKTFKDYDGYLKQIYGDYMKLPPVEKQKSHHMFTAFYE